MRKIEEIHPNPRANLTPTLSFGGEGARTKNSPCFFKRKGLGDGLLKTNYGALDTRYGKLAFTLVELIVVIVILGVLATISYLGFQDYPKQARDVVRISDAKNIEKAIEFFKIRDGDYPIPTGGETNTGEIEGFSGTWYIGTFGKEIGDKIEEMTETPTEPNTKKTYTYLLSEDKKNYRIITKLEETGEDYVVANMIKHLSKTNGNLPYCDFSGTYNFGGCLIK